MRLNRGRAVLAIAAVAVAAPLMAHEPSAPAGQVATLPAAARSAAATVDAFHAALRRGDTKSAAALLADEAMIFESGEAERTKTEYAAHHLPADAEFAKTVSSKITDRTGDSNGAFSWIATEGRTTGAYKGRAIDLVTTETMILHRSGTGWKIVHIHWSSEAKR